MYPYHNSHDALQQIVAAAISLGTLIIMLCLLIWLTAKVGFFLLCLFSSDGGIRVREQRQRHRLENLAGRMTLLCFIAGVSLIATGQGAGAIDVTLPGGIEIKNAGTGVVLIGVGNSLLWMLLHFRHSKSEASDGDETVESTPVAAPTQIAGNNAVVVSNGNTPSLFPSWLDNMKYWHAGVITLILLPILNIFALPIGGYLAWRVTKNRGAIGTLTRG
jgi:hypothetical protein